MGGRCMPNLKFCTSTTHFGAQIITSMAIVNAKRDTVHLTMMQISRRCHPVVIVVYKTQLKVMKVCLYQV